MPPSKIQLATGGFRLFYCSENNFYFEQCRHLWTTKKQNKTKQALWQEDTFLKKRGKYRHIQGIQPTPAGDSTTHRTQSPLPPPGATRQQQGALISSTHRHATRAPAPERTCSEGGWPKKKRYGAHVQSATNSNLSAAKEKNPAATWLNKQLNPIQNSYR